MKHVKYPYKQYFGVCIPSAEALQKRGPLYSFGSRPSHEFPILRMTFTCAIAVGRSWRSFAQSISNVIALGFEIAQRSMLIIERSPLCCPAQ